jgi:hypothetical protein
MLEIEVLRAVEPGAGIDVTQQAYHNILLVGLGRIPKMFYRARRVLRVLRGVNEKSAQFFTSL